MQNAKCRINYSVKIADDKEAAFLFFATPTKYKMCNVRQIIIYEIIEIISNELVLIKSTAKKNTPGPSKSSNIDTSATSIIASTKHAVFFPGLPERLTPSIPITSSSGEQTRPIIPAAVNNGDNEKPTCCGSA